MTRRAARCLERGLRALDARSDAALRVVGHAATRRHEVFEVEEAVPTGAGGRRFLVSVSADGADALVLPMATGRAAA
jgi:hypothetical protein